jgi:hypothetical protein
MLIWETRLAKFLFQFFFLEFILITGYNIVTDINRYFEDEIYSWGGAVL